MTPKQKAINLFARLTPLSNDLTPIEKVERDYRWAKKCALVCVSEIINANPHSNPLNTSPVTSTMNYWNEVKQEIEKL